MKLVVLGSGTATPHPRRSSAAFWLETASGTLMLDFGASALHRLAQENLDWANLDAIWISHFHLDHCCGIAAYLFATKHAVETQERTKPLRICGAKGVKRLIENFDRVNNYRLFKQPFPIEIIEIEALSKFDLLSGVKAMAVKTPHTADSYAIRIEDTAGKVVVYTSDTGFGKELSTFGRQADLFITESSFFREKKTEIHLNLAEAMYLIRMAHPKRAMLTHFYAEWDDVNFVDELAAFSPQCDVIQAYDGLGLEV